MKAEKKKKAIKKKSHQKVNTGITKTELRTQIRVAHNINVKKKKVVIKNKSSQKIGTDVTKIKQNTQVKNASKVTGHGQDSKKANPLKRKKFDPVGKADKLHNQNISETKKPKKVSVTKTSIASLLNPDGYCVPELKSFFEKREKPQKEENSKRKKNKLPNEPSIKKLKVSEEVKQDVFDLSLEQGVNESDEENDVEVPTRKKKKFRRDQEKESRTVFVGNLPLSWSKKKIVRHFSKFGTVDSLRLRCAPLADLRVPKKVAVITKNFHPDRTSIAGYVRFIDKESAISALQANGTLFGDHHIRVDLALNKPASTCDKKRAIFVGNVPFSAEDDHLWKHFENCGAIEDAHIIRDSTGMGKGYAFVSFKSQDSVELAMKMNGEKLNGRELRICRNIDVTRNKKKDKVRRDKNISRQGKKPQKNDGKNVIANSLDLKETKALKHKKSNFVGKDAKFLGQTVTGTKKPKKKKKLNKVAQKKRLLINILGGQSKKKVDLRGLSKKK